MPSLDDRAIRERLRRRAHLIRLRTSAINRTFGIQTQFGLRRGITALRKPGAVDELAEHGIMPEVWLQSIRTLLGVIDDLDRQLAPLERELRPFARRDERARLLMTIPGVAELLALTLAAEIGDISRFPSARKLVGYAGLGPRVKQSGQGSHTGRLSKAGPATLRWAAVEASQHAWRPTTPWNPLYGDIKRRHGKANPGQVRRRAQGPHRQLARPLPQRAVRTERRARHRSCPGKLLHSSGRPRHPADGDDARYRFGVAASGSEEHRERARRAQQLSDRAREQASSERAGAERCENLMADASDPGMRELHRQAADLHRQAQHQYEEVAELQRLHADHERAAAERAVAREDDPGAAVDRRDIIADERDHVANVREATADERERRAGEREQLQDERERELDARERRFDKASGRWTPRQRDHLNQAKAALRRVEARLARTDADGARDDARASRDQATVDRESAATARSQPPPGNRPSDEPR